MKNKPLLIALDVNRSEDALVLAAQLSPELCRIKVGKELYTREGRALVETLQGIGYDIFLDLKFHDIPNTVASALRVAADMGVWMVNVHASGGRKMLEAAAVLTSLSEGELHDELGIAEPLAAHVARLTALAADSGLNGVVCSAHEAGAVKAAHGSDFLTVTPGIRPAGVAADDQTRTMTPAAALKAGSDYLVIGRPVTRAAKPAVALADIIASIAKGE